MNKFQSVLKDNVVPVGEKIASNRYLQAIKNSFIMFTPFLIVGSVFLLISNFPIPAYSELMTNVFGEGWDAVISIPSDAVYSFMAMFITFLVGYNFAKIEDVDPISSGVLSVVVFIILTPLASSDELGTVLPLEWLGSNGIFVGFLVSFTTVNIFKQFIRRDFVIKMPEQVPPEVSRSFSAIVPSMAIMSIALLIRDIFSKTEFGTIHDFIFGVIAAPVGALGTSYIGTLLYSLLTSSLWSIGINATSSINAIIRPFWYVNGMENLTAYQQGISPLPHVIAEPFFDMVFMGGSGVTLGLLIAMLIRSKSKQNRTIARLSITPGCFNINEPVIFGLPVMLNPIMLIPFNIVPLVLITTQYAAMSLDLVARPTGIIVPWTTPPIISGFLITGSISGSIMQLVNLAIAVAIYYPFMRIIDSQNYEKETEEKQVNEEVDDVEEFLRSAIDFL